MVVRVHFLVLVLLVACVSGGAPAKAIYGDDDRVEFYEVSDPLQTIARSMAALTNIRTLGNNYLTPSLASDTVLGTSQNLCEGEAFADQPTAAFCSGSLIGPDRILTAGHCIDSGDCCNTRFVFDYHYESEGTLGNITHSEDVYHCRRVHSILGSSWDYAIVQLDRPVVGRVPLAVRGTNTPVSISDELTMMGYPSGLPLKIQETARVYSPGDGAKYFEAYTDSFGGNSGSGIYSVADQEIVGILVRGVTDYVSSGTCNVAATYPCDDSDCSSSRPDYNNEDCSYAYQAVVDAPECVTNEDCANAATGSVCDVSCLDGVVGCSGWCTSGVGGGELSCAVEESHFDQYMPDCRVPSMNNYRFVGDGDCDTSGGYNTPECGYDGGDCCEFSCVPATYSCSSGWGSCADVNDCATENGGCSDECVVDRSSFTCLCGGAVCVDGCTDSLASNYNAAATVDDGSCAYSVIAECDGDVGSIPLAVLAALSIQVPDDQLCKNPTAA